MRAAAMKMEETEIINKPLGYRVTRTTIALAAASATFKAMQDDKLRRAIEEVQRLNYDFDRIPDSTLEYIYAVFDDETMTRVKDEFEFVPGLGSLTDYGGRSGVCALCGKGDSRDDGANEDMLRYAFKLSNVNGGGQDLWVGSTCIVNHALKVRGAETAAHAKRILEKSLREHLAMWKIEAWRASHPDHVNITTQFERLKKRSIELGHMRYSREADATILLGNTALTTTDRSYRYGGIYALKQQVAGITRKFGTATRFYVRRGHVTKQKMAAWEQGRAMLKSLDWLFTTLAKAEQEVPYPGVHRREWLQRARAERDAAIEAHKRRKRTPSE